MHLIDPVAFEQRQTGTLPGHLGVTLDDQGQGSITCSIVIQRHHMSPNGFLHAASVVALADSGGGQLLHHERGQRHGAGLPALECADGDLSGQRHRVAVQVDPVAQEIDIRNTKRGHLTPAQTSGAH